MALLRTRFFLSLSALPENALARGVVATLLATAGAGVTLAVVVAVSSTACISGATPDCDGEAAASCSQGFDAMLDSSKAADAGAGTDASDAADGGQAASDAPASSG